MSRELVLTGLDGTNPLGYLAALGALRALDDHSQDARLGWRLLDAWRPVLAAPDLDREVLVDTLVSDVESWRTAAPELDLCYEKTTAKSTQTIHELKAPPAEFQAFAARSVVRALDGSRRFADYVASYAAAHQRLGGDTSGSTKPTALHFLAGQQLFLTAVRSLLADVRREDLDEAVFGPWRYEGRLPVLGWDVVAGERDYALRATDPSHDKKFGVPGADWLGFRGMAFFPVVLRDGHAATTGFEGRGKRYSFSWALWEAPLQLDAVRTVVATRWDAVTAGERAARGIPIVLTSRVRRTDQGGYGSFTAAGVPAARG